MPFRTEAHSDLSLQQNGGSYNRDRLPLSAHKEPETKDPTSQAKEHHHHTRIEEILDSAIVKIGKTPDDPQPVADEAQSGLQLIFQNLRDHHRVRQDRHGDLLSGEIEGSDALVKPGGHTGFEVHGNILRVHSQSRGSSGETIESEIIGDIDIGSVDYASVQYRFIHPTDHEYNRYYRKNIRFIEEGLRSPEIVDRAEGGVRSGIKAKNNHYRLTKLFHTYSEEDIVPGEIFPGRIAETAVFKEKSATTKELEEKLAVNPDKLANDKERMGYFQNVLDYICSINRDLDDPKKIPFIEDYADAIGLHKPKDGELEPGSTKNGLLDKLRDAGFYSISHKGEVRIVSEAQISKPQEDDEVVVLSAQYNSGRAAVSVSILDHIRDHEDKDTVMGVKRRLTRLTLSTHNPAIRGKMGMFLSRQDYSLHKIKGWERALVNFRTQHIIPHHKRNFIDEFVDPTDRNWNTGMHPWPAASMDDSAAGFITDEERTRIDETYKAKDKHTIASKAGIYNNKNLIDKTRATTALLKGLTFRRP